MSVETSFLFWITIIWYKIRSIINVKSEILKQTFHLIFVIEKHSLTCFLVKTLHSQWTLSLITKCTNRCSAHLDWKEKKNKNEDAKIAIRNEIYSRKLPTYCISYWNVSHENIISLWQCCAAGLSRRRVLLVTIFVAWGGKLSKFYEKKELLRIWG